MAPIGKDVISGAVASRAISMISASSANKTWDIQFDALNLAQVPSFLLISVPRLGSQYSLADATKTADGATEIFVGENCVRNLSRNLSIKKLKIIVNSARGAIDEDGSDQTGFVNAERLFELTQENAGSHYFAKGGFRAWRDYGCAVLLNSSQFAPGLQVCDGVAYPIQIQIQMTVENRCVSVSAQNLCGANVTHSSVRRRGGTSGPLLRESRTRPNRRLRSRTGPVHCNLHQGSFGDDRNECDNKCDELSAR